MTIHDFDDATINPDLEKPCDAVNENERDTINEVLTQKNGTAQISLLSGENKMTLSSPVKELEEFKTSFKAMMVAFSNFVESAGIEMGKNEEKEQINLLIAQLQQTKEESRSEESKLREEFDKFKEEVSAQQARDSEEYVKLKEFERFREAIRAAI